MHPSTTCTHTQQHPFRAEVVTSFPRLPTCLPRASAAAFLPACSPRASQRCSCRPACLGLALLVMEGIAGKRRAQCGEGGDGTHASVMLDGRHPLCKERAQPWGAPSDSTRGAAAGNKRCWLLVSLHPPAACCRPSTHLPRRRPCSTTWTRCGARASLPTCRSVARSSWGLVTREARNGSGEQAEAGGKAPLLALAGACPPCCWQQCSDRPPPVAGRPCCTWHAPVAPTLVRAPPPTCCVAR